MPRRSASKKTGRSTVRAAREKVILGLHGLGSVVSHGMKKDLQERGIIM